MDSSKNNFDLLRTWLAFLVVIAHFNELSGIRTDFFLFNASGLAVDAFFIVSGFLVSLSYERCRSMLVYATKRFFRIYPLYLVVIFMQFFVFVLLVAQEENCLEYFKYLAANLTFLNFLSPSVGDPFGPITGYTAINGSLWTLKIEVGFYAILPLISLLVFRFGVFSLIFIYLISSIFYIYFLDDQHRLDEQLPAQLRFFIVGMLVLKCMDRLSESRSVVFFVGLAIFLSVIVASVSFVFYDALIYPVLLGLIVYTLAFFTPRIVMRWDISYPIYVLHFPILQLLMYFGVMQSGLWLFMLSFIGILIPLSFLLHILIEMPFLRMANFLVKK